jgi:hypothetical protein
MQKILFAAISIAMAAACHSSFARGGGQSSGSHSSGVRSSGAHFSSARANGAPGVHTVRGYTKRNGTVVAPYHATNPNGTKRDNFSTKGNVNPYTGKPGTKDANK